jgi:hypothetical protein
MPFGLPFCDEANATMSSLSYAVRISHNPILPFAAPSIQNSNQQLRIKRTSKKPVRSK